MFSFLKVPHAELLMENGTSTVGPSSNFCAAFNLSSTIGHELIFLIMECQLLSYKGFSTLGFDFHIFEDCLGQKGMNIEYLREREIMTLASKESCGTFKQESTGDITPIQGRLQVCQIIDRYENILI